MKRESFVLFLVLLILKGRLIESLTIQLEKEQHKGAVVVRWTLLNANSSSSSSSYPSSCEEIAFWLTPLVQSVNHLHADVFHFELVFGDDDDDDDDARLPRALGYRTSFSSSHTNLSPSSVSPSSALSPPLFFELCQGEKKSIEIDLAEHYEFPAKGGSYHVSYRAPLTIRNTEQRSEGAVWVESNRVRVDITPEEAAQAREKGQSHPSKGTNEEPQNKKSSTQIRAMSGCSSFQSALLGSSTSGVIGNTVSGISGCLNHLQTTGADGLFINWFGGTNNANVVAQYLSAALNLYSSGAANFVCETCASTIGSTAIPAYVYPSDSARTIHLCTDSSYFSFSFAPSPVMFRWDSIPGLFLAQASLFFGASTNLDSRSSCLSTASSCFSSSISCNQPCNNADCLQYYCEDYSSLSCVCFFLFFFSYFFLFFPIFSYFLLFLFFVY